MRIPPQSATLALRRTVTSFGYGRTAAYRRIHSGSTSISPVASFLPRYSHGLKAYYPFSSTDLSSILSSRLPSQLLLCRAPATYIRNFHSQIPLRQAASPKEQAKQQQEPAQDPPPSSSSSSSSSSPPPPPPPSAAEAENTARSASRDSADQTSEAKSKAEQEGSSSSSESSESSESSGKEKAKDNGEAADDQTPPPPPPPHGDKTPWQVFTETLKTEFKASKEWNESTKALQSGYEELAQNPALQKAKSAYEQASSTATSTTSAAFRHTGKAIGSSAAWAWETPVVKVVRKGASAAGSGIEKATRPVRETEAFKNVKNVIDDGSSSRYGGWVEKEERRRKRELRNAQGGGGGNGSTSEAMVEDPEAGTKVTLHKDAAWKESWREFRDSSRLMQSVFSLKSTYQESENPLISTARSISDRVAGFFAENETAMVIKKFREMDPSFQLEPFLTEMREYILPEVLDAYVKGDTETLKLWLSAAQYQVYAALMQQYTTNGLKSDGRILDIRHVDILSARILEPGDIPVFILTARTQEVHVYRNIKSGELAAGMDDKVQQVTYAIGVTRIPEDVNNAETRGWRLIELQKSARDYI